MDKTVLLLIDDTFPKPQWTYQRICDLINMCCSEENHTPFRILQESWHPPLPDPNRGIIGKGIKGEYDFATILSPEGAVLMLDIASQAPLDFPFQDFVKLQRIQTRKEYFYGTWHMHICDGNNHLWESDLSI